MGLAFFSVKVAMFNLTLSVVVTENTNGRTVTKRLFGSYPSPSRVSKHYTFLTQKIPCFSKHSLQGSFCWLTM